MGEKDGFGTHKQRHEGGEDPNAAKVRAMREKEAAQLEGTQQDPNAVVRSQNRSPAPPEAGRTGGASPKDKE